MSEQKKSRMNSDIMSGLLFILLGGWFCFTSLATLKIGNAFRMGPGFFPAFIGGGLFLLGIVITYKGWRAKTGEDFGKVPWKAVIMIPVGFILFGLSVRPLGLAIALFLLCLVAAIASSREFNLVKSLVTALAMTALCIAIFSFGLGVNIPLVGDWLR